MKDKNSSESRRKLLKSIAAGSGAIVAGKSLPESWSRPVVDSVMLPAHAETSMRIFGADNEPLMIGSIFESASDSMLTRLFDSAIEGLVPSAIAGGKGINPNSYSACAEVNGSNLETWFQLFDDMYLIGDYAGTLPLSGKGNFSLTVYGDEETCEPTDKIVVPVEVTDNGDSVTIAGLDENEGSITFPTIPACPMKATCTRPV